MAESTYQFRKFGESTTHLLLQSAIMNKIGERQILGEDEVLIGDRWIAVSDASAFADAVGSVTMRRRVPIEEPEIDLAPMIDCTFLLLLFFMITATYTRQRAIATPGVAPPSPTRAAVVHKIKEIEEKDIVVRIDKANRVEVDGKPVEHKDLRAVLEKQKRDRGKSSLTIIADDDAHHGTVVRVLDAASLAGIVENVRYGHSVPPPGKGPSKP